MPSKKAGGKPTSSDVAAAAGVSRSAVSCAFNNPQRISVATRERILAVAREIGYTPNTLARMLQAGRHPVAGRAAAGAVGPDHGEPVLLPLPDGRRPGL
ncbi:LacI family DNA-binding transcriptional regulator [Amorphoplanes digitatis]|uniref:LacI family DNA-binding transcriptional regulator n=1 Tax=Actinoplanes digitatis TaxID=1868 RepID=UPI00361850DA